MTWGIADLRSCVNYVPFQGVCPVTGPPFHMKEILVAALLAALPADRETVPMDALAAIAAGDEFPATTTYTKRVEYIDFNSFGQEFTQVVVILTPDKPRLHAGRKLVVVGGEPG